MAKSTSKTTAKKRRKEEAAQEPDIDMSDAAGTESPTDEQSSGQEEGGVPQDHGATAALFNGASETQEAQAVKPVSGFVVGKCIRCEAGGTVRGEAVVENGVYKGDVYSCDACGRQTNNYFELTGGDDL